MDLSSEIKAGGDLDPSVWPSALNDLLQYNGKYYATPLNYATLMMYYHKDLFTAAGITAPPTTWAEWQSDIKKLTKADGSQYGMPSASTTLSPTTPYCCGRTVATSSRMVSLLFPALRASRRSRPGPTWSRTIRSALLA